MIGILNYKAWLIEPMFASRMTPIILRAIEQGTFNQFIQQNRETNEKIISALYGGLDAEMVYGNYNDPPYYIATSKSGVKVAIVGMMGAITKNGDACSYGMRNFENTFALIAKNESIGALLVHYNNAPGGSHDGTPELGSILANYPKANVAFVDGYAASAHYWMASQQNHIMMNKLTPSEVGSIGSLVVYQNIGNQIEKGVYPTIEIIRAPQSVNKARLNSIEPLTDELRAELNDELKDAVNMFIKAVKTGRGEALTDDKEMFTGKMYSTDEAIKNGLADTKGSMQDAINKAGELAKNQTGTTARKANANTNMNLKSKLISGIFGKSEKAEDGKPTANDQASVEAADVKAAEIEAENSQLKETSAALESKVSGLEKTVSELNAQVSTLTGANAKLVEEKTTLENKLKEEPAGKATTVVSDSDPEEGKEDSRVKSADEIEADEYHKAMNSNFL